MGYPHPHFQGPIGGPAMEPKFPPTEDFLSPYHHHHHHHHMHLNHHNHSSSVSPLHNNGYASNAGPGGVGAAGNASLNPMAGNLQPAVDYYGNSSNYNYPTNNYYNQQQQQQQSLTAHLPPANVSPLNSSANSVPNPTNSVQQQQQQSASLDAYTNNGNITELASVPSTQTTTGGLNHTTMHPYSAATAAVTNSGVSSANAGGVGGGAGGLVGSYYSGYYGGTAPHHHSVLDLPIQCPHAEPINTALGLQELGKFELILPSAKMKAGDDDEEGS